MCVDEHVFVYFSIATETQKKYVPRLFDINKELKLVRWRNDVAKNYRD